MKDLILELPNYIPDNLCDHLIKKFQNDPRKEPGYVHYTDKPEVIPELKKSLELTISVLDDWKQEDQHIHNLVCIGVKTYYEYLKSEFDYKQIMHTFEALLWKPTRDLGYTIQCQEKNGKYAWHYDGSRSHEFLLIIMYLNTLEPGEGGETEFSCGRKIRPEKGKMMICPSSWTYPHCGNEVLGKNKYTCVTRVDLV